MSPFLEWRARSITGHLILFALGVTLPILIVSGLVGWAYLHQEEKRIDLLAEQQAHAFVSQIDNHLGAFQATLNVLTASPPLLEGNMDAFRLQLEQIKLPPDIWITVRDRSGKQLLNTTTPRGTPLPTFPGRGDPMIFGEGRSYTSDLIWAPMTNQWAVTLSAPVRVPAVTGEVKLALTIAVPADYFKKILTNAPLGWIATINDRNGNILARSLAHDQWVGKPMARIGWEITKDVPPGQHGLWKDVYSLEGTKVVGAYDRMESTGWLIGVTALPVVFEAPRRNIIRVGLGLIIASLLLAVSLALVMGRRITDALTVLQIKAAAMQDMRLIDVPITSLREVNAVARIMRNTALVLRERQDQQTTLIQELNHRVKNTLATVQAIGRMTMRNSPDMASFEKSFTARLLALSATHNLLTESGWSGVDLRELLTKELAPFQADSRLSLKGPSVTLTSKVAIALGMAIHEMATNATKYGALRSDVGSVSIEWSVSAGILTFRWREKCHEPITLPSRRGFGSRLIQQTIVVELQGTADTAYSDNGLQSVLTIPLDDELADKPGPDHTIKVSTAVESHGRDRLDQADLYGRIEP